MTKTLSLNTYTVMQTYNSWFKNVAQLELTTFKLIKIIKWETKAKPMLRLPITSIKVMK